MIGDIILFIKKWWKQNITCIHHYEHRIGAACSYDECTKCGRTKNYFWLR